MKPAFVQPVIRRLEQLGWTNYRLMKKLEGRVPASTLYAFLRGENVINSEALAHIFDVTGIRLIAEPEQELAVNVSVEHSKRRGK